MRPVATLQPPSPLTVEPIIISGEPVTALDLLRQYELGRIGLSAEQIVPLIKLGRELGSMTIINIDAEPTAV